MKNINIVTAMAKATLLLNREVSRKEIAEALNITAQYACKVKEKPLSVEQIKLIEEKLNITFPVDETTELVASQSNTDKQEIVYWGKGLPCEEKLKNPFITSLWFDSEVINYCWQKNVADLNIIAMPGDKMDGGIYPLKNGDILIIDKSQTDVSISGVYFYTTNNNEEVFVNNFRKKFDGSVVLGYSNQKYDDAIVSMEQLEAAGINVVGRVIKNLFLMI